MNRAVQPERVPRGLTFRFNRVKGLYYLCCETKALISCAVTEQLTCAFNFAYAKSKVSSDAA